MTEQAQTDASPACGQSLSTELLERFEAWWEAHGQYCRAGGGDYEKTFAFRAWEAAEQAGHNDCMLHVFDGYRVYCSMTEKAKARTSYENVSDTLDSLAKLMRSNVEVRGR